MSTRREILAALAVGVAGKALFGPSRAHAQSPLRQLTIVVGFPAGGGTDMAARVVAEGLRGRYAETVIVENRLGAAGRIATAQVKDAAADGTVMLFTPAFPLAIFPHIYRKLPYDALADFVPVATTSKGAFVLSVGPGVPASVVNATDFVAWCKANPDKATYGAPSGGGQHFAGVLFARQSQAPLRMVPYKGGAPSVTDAIGGHIASVITPLSEVIQHAREGRLRLLATTTRQRSQFTPEVPTMGELGWDVVFDDWSGLVAPARTPPELVGRVNALVADVVRSPAGMGALQNLGIDIDINTPDEFGKIYRSTWERYRDVVRSTGFTAED
jgi:tripartite-type tricarboxylate transporter receptor subunit TctC